MTTAADLGHLSFYGIRIPYQSLAIKGGMRNHTHVYAHSPGGAPEKNGRSLYEITVATIFNDDSSERRLWPDRLNHLTRIFEGGETHDLTLPQIGTIQAFATGWTRTLTAQALNGEDVSITFLEDQSYAFLMSRMLTTRKQSLYVHAQTLQDFSVTVSPVPSIFDEIQSAVNGVFAVFDQADLYGGLVVAKAEQLFAILERADKTIDTLKDPLNHEALRALHEMMLRSLDLIESVASSPDPFSTWTVPQPMTATEISMSIFGNTTRTGDIIQLNAIEDPFNVPAGATIRYFK